MKAAKIKPSKASLDAMDILNIACGLLERKNVIAPRSYNIQDFFFVMVWGWNSIIVPILTISDDIYFVIDGT